MRRISFLYVSMCLSIYRKLEDAVVEAMTWCLKGWVQKEEGGCLESSTLKFSLHSGDNCPMVKFVGPTGDAHDDEPPMCKRRDHAFKNARTAWTEKSCSHDRQASSDQFDDFGTSGPSEEVLFCLLPKPHKKFSPRICDMARLMGCNNAASNQPHDDAVNPASAIEITLLEVTAGTVCVG
jgi:hypothetical protein